MYIYQIENIGASINVYHHYGETRKKSNFDKLNQDFYYRRKYKSFNNSFIFTKLVNIYVMIEMIYNVRT